MRYVANRDQIMTFPGQSISAEGPAPENASLSLLLAMLHSSAN
jgi:hypothetical protein